MYELSEKSVSVASYIVQKMYELTEKSVSVSSYIVQGKNVRTDRIGRSVQMYKSAICTFVQCDGVRAHNSGWRVGELVSFF